MGIIQRLARLKTWHFFCLAVISSEILTLFLNVLQSLLRWGIVERSLIEIGTIDAVLVSFIVTAIMMPLIRYSAKAEAALEESEVQYRRLVDNSLVGIFKTNLRGDILYANEALVRMAGFDSASELMKESVLTRYKSERDRTSLLNLLREKGKVSSFECELVKKNGESISILLSAVLDKEMLSGMVMDIADRKKTEEALRLSEDRLMLALTATNDGLWDWDIGKGVAYLSPKYYEMTGYRPEEASPDLSFFKRLVYHDDLPRVLHSIDDHLRAKTAQSFIDYRMVTKDGTVKWIAGRGKVVERGEDGTPLRMVGTITDITERKRVEEEIRRLNLELHQHAVELERAYKDMESFSYVVSHDLKAPARRITGFSTILLRDHADNIDEYGKDLLSRIEKNARMMGQLIDDLFAFSRISTREIQKAEINMEILAKKAYEELKPHAEGRKVLLTVEPMPSARGDPTMIRQVVLNLLSNAFKFTRTRDTAIIDIGCCHEGNEYVFFVKDNGTGFDMQFSDKLFGLFQRIHTSKEFEGTGIGLVIVKEIIQKHGGRVWAEGRVNEGATFYFSLPQA